MCCHGPGQHNEQQCGFTSPRLLSPPKSLKVAGPTGLKVLEIEMGVCAAGVLSFWVPLPCVFVWKKQGRPRIATPAHSGQVLWLKQRTHTHTSPFLSLSTSITHHSVCVWLCVLLKQGDFGFGTVICDCRVFSDSSNYRFSIRLSFDSFPSRSFLCEQSHLHCFSLTHIKNDLFLVLVFDLFRQTV